MNRLRVRVELNRRKTGVPMEELVSVVDETRKFFHLLAEDVQIPADRGEWLASNFEPDSLNFTAEFSGAASADQIRAFGSAFGGATSLRRETIAQFTHIADFIGEDELVGFGLYQSDQETEPSDWRCLSRRDALRFAGEIQLLAKAVGESETESSLPTVMNGSVGGRRLFKDRREREALATDPSRRIRDVESNLSRRISLLESEVEAHTRKMQGLGITQEAADERFARLLGAMESFWSQAPRQLALMGVEQGSPGGASLGEIAQTVAGNPFACAPLPVHVPTSRRRRILGLALAGAVLILGGFVFIGGSEIGREWARSLGSFAHRLTLEPVAASSIQPTATPPNVHLLNVVSEPSGLEGSNLKESIGEEKTVPPVSTLISTDTRPQIKRASSESGAISPSRETGGDGLRQIALDIPFDLRSTITEPVLVNVIISSDQTGRVTTAKVASTKGEEAGLLTDEALRVARRFRFRPIRHGSKTITSQTALTFVFDPDPIVVSPEGVTPEN